VVLHLADDDNARAQVDTMKPVVIVTGVGPGIGTSIARAFGAEGFAIALLSAPSNTDDHAMTTPANQTSV
jgi:NAD(P)-dependent dehydrogenase (short-subunit alcohol dehydrogenase family)